MTDSSTIDNDTPECPSDAVSFPLQDLPPEIRELVWIMAAEQAADAFRHKYPDFNRFWSAQHRPPYIYFTADTIDNRGDSYPSIVRDLRGFFWPLFLTNTESHAIVSRYISMFHQRRKAPQLTLNFVDIFTLGQALLDYIIQFSRRSTEALRSKATIEFTGRYPAVLQAAFEDQLEEIASVMNVSIRASMFAKPETNQARLLMLLQFINLKRVYIDVWGLRHCDYENLYRGQVGVFVELSKFRNGKFRMKYNDFDSFFQAYRDSSGRFGGDADARELARVATGVWEDVQA
ncbi:uncharacterized protein F4817DRAFT_329007 [Daldinia loculata]|uniref:uncharacterized protein n=1 Tax=Daldinia loculata TaxID=103429 RepID=UPI0020C52FD2|nr:uncharacterized protein F4817DRAFT_329007 [Daldinia loculata]KAI1650314.1 hypothetical protein F4817DRAFT_329007 [Daldinia loculata]